VRTERDGSGQPGVSGRPPGDAASAPPAARSARIPPACRPAGPWRRAALARAPVPGGDGSGGEAGHAPVAGDRPHAAGEHDHQARHPGQDDIDHDPGEHQPDADQDPGAAAMTRRLQCIRGSAACTASANRGSSARSARSICSSWRCSCSESGTVPSHGSHAGTLASRPWGCPQYERECGCGRAHRSWAASAGDRRADQLDGFAVARC
jgi:hypothetical protein